VTARVILIAMLAAACVPQPAIAQRAADTGSVRELLQTARRQSQGGDAAGALASLRTARSLAPNAEEVLGAFVQAALAARTLGPAIATLDALTRMCPDVAQYHYALGVTLMEIGDVAAARPSLEQANRLEPDRPRTLLALALAFNSGKQYGEAKAAALKSVELDPENVDAIAALAEAEAGSGATRDAEAHARQVLTASPTHATANLVIGIVLMQQERYADARDALAKAVANNPASAAAHYQLSLAYARLGEEARAQQQVELYRQKLREAEERIKAARAAAAGEKP
jgi:tetratricopeptide (TPR) repeat protein